MADRITERRRYAKTAAKFARLEGMREAGAPARDIRKTSDVWVNRSTGNPGSMHKPDQRPRKDCPAPTAFQPKPMQRARGAA